MTQVPLPPLGETPESPFEFTTPLPSQKRRSIFGKVFRGIGWLGSSPIHWIGIKSIRQGGSFIGDLAKRGRAPSRRDPSFKTREQGVFDLDATAFCIGESVAQLERHLASRRKQTALSAYLFGLLGSAFIVGWLFRILSTPLAGARLVLAIDFLPLCLVFVLFAYYQALVNFQIRVGRTAGWYEFLTTEQGFWPRT